MRSFIKRNKLCLEILLKRLTINQEIRRKNNQMLADETGKSRKPNGQII